MKKETSRLSAATVVLVDVLLALVLVGLLFGFYSSRIFSRVQGNDMFPTYRNSDFLLCKKGGLYQRGDILCYRGNKNIRTERETGLSIRRIVGLPGETVEITPEGDIFIDGAKLEESYLEPGSRPPPTGRTASCRSPWGMMNFSFWETTGRPPSTPGTLDPSVRPWPKDGPWPTRI